MSIMSPVWCMHCRESLGNRVEAWMALRPENDHEALNRDGRKASDILDALGLDRACCRSTLLTMNPRIADYNKYKRPNINTKATTKTADADESAANGMDDFFALSQERQDV